MRNNQNSLEKSFIRNISKIGLVLALITAFVVGLAGASSTVTATVGTVFTPICSISVTGSPFWTNVTTGIQTPQLSINTNSVIVTNTGNKNAAISVSGTDWFNGAIDLTGSVGWTSYNMNSGASGERSFLGPGTTLTSTPTNTGVTITPSNLEYFGFALLIPSGQGAAGMTQTIVYVASC